MSRKKLLSLRTHNRKPETWRDVFPESRPDNLDSAERYVRAGQRGEKLIADHQWANHKTLSGLPNEARREEAILIMIYRDQASSPPNLPKRKTADQLRSVAATSARLLNEVDSLYDNGTALDRIIDANGWELLRLDAFFEELKAFRDLIKRNSSVTGRDKPGPSDTNLLGLVTSLDQLLLTHGNTLKTRQNKDSKSGIDLHGYILAAAKLADPKLAETTITNTIRKVVQSRAVKRWR